jgi:ribose transport system substrate-binding protein
MIRVLLARIFLATVFVISASCGSHGGSGARQYVVAFSQANSAEPYRAAQNKLMQKLLASYSDVQLVIADAQQDNSKQIAQIETFIRQKPSLLIVAPNERAPLTAVMGKAVAAGIPVICLERDITAPNYTTFIGVDNQAIGRMAGEFIREELSRRNGAPRGKIVEIRGLLGVEAQTERHEGAREVLSAYPGIEVVHQAVADWLQSNARERMLEILRAEPKIDAVYAHNDPMAIGAYLAAREIGREREMFFVGIDALGGPAGGIRKVTDGVLAATFYYPLCVDKAVEIGNRLMREPGFKPEQRYILDSSSVTPANAQQMYERLTF